MLDIGQEFDSVRGVYTSSRWRVVAISREARTVDLLEIGSRVGEAPPSYVASHRDRTAARFKDWPLEEWPLPSDDEEIKRRTKTVSIETLLKGSDYVPADPGTMNQPTLGVE